MSDNTVSSVLRPTAGRAGGLLSAVTRFQVAVAKAVEPRASGLPNLLVLLGVPSVVLVLFVVLVCLGWSGSSTGVYWQTFGTGADPDLLLGQPRGIRSDEWLVQSSWIVSQSEQGFPGVNRTLPGGMDATIQNDLPSWEWSSLFRPHVLGFLLLPLDQGMAVRWWLPLAVMFIAAYVFVVLLMPRRPVVAVLVVTSLAFSPLIQWWFLPTTIWPVAWAFTALSTMVLLCRPGRPWVRWVAAACTGYLTVTVAMSIYVPFLVPPAVVVVVVAIGFLFSTRQQGTTLRQLSRRLLPLFVAAAGAVVVLLVWVLTRLSTVESVLGTVYPGQRLESTGAQSFGGLVAMFSAPFQRVLQFGVTGSLGPNASESASPLLLSVFLVFPVIWFIVHDRRSTGRWDWVLASIVAAVALVFAFLLVPHWDAVAHALLLDRTTVARVRLAFDVLNVVVVAVLGNRLSERRVRMPWATALLGAAAVTGSAATVYAVLRAQDSPVLEASAAWRVVVVLLVVAVIAYARRGPFVGAVAFLAASLVVGAGVNPLYRGVFDLNDTAAGREIQTIRADDPDATWVGIGSYVSTAMLVESGVQAYNGVQTYPPQEMWEEIDPDGSDEELWNRLANVTWVPSEGEPRVLNPVRDQIQVTFDACSSFAEEHVDYVLSDTRIDSSCATQLSESRQGGSTLFVYEVTR